MINHKKLVAMARKWQKLAAIGRRRISSARATMHRRSAANWWPMIKGHFVVYTADNGRFVIPLAYLSNPIFIELLRISEEEFGLPSDGPITLPCDAVFVEYIISIATCRCLPSSSLHQQPNPPLLVN
uniref:Auxin-responsive protein SAUR68-like n=1 Tax=Nelumbo nucifera TaxID=4432 RepID=A0A822ZXI3_NELNU|nr:TPA_asm: hypothetical protein HUJ06_016545 [Nelumbo nucifera]